MAAREESDLFMSVRLEHSARICNVLVSAQTTGQDVIECLKPDDDKVYYLVEIWKGCERPISHEEKLKNVLLQWGSDLDDVTFMLKEKLSRKNNPQKKHKSPRNSPVQLPNDIHEQQMKVESMEKELQEKEKYLHVLRSKDAAKNGLKSNYVRRLEQKVLEQEEQLKRLQKIEKELFQYQVENEKLAVELQRVRSMFSFKHQQLAEASARIELLTRELSVKRREEMIDKDLEMTEERLSKQEKTKLLLNESQQYQRHTAEQTDNKPERKPLGHQPVGHQPAGHHLALANQPIPPLTEKELLRLTDNMVHKKQRGEIKKQRQSVKNGPVFKHGLVNDDSNGLSSWRDDDENDTETSADSGHVSVDSPSYQSLGLGSSFYFNGVSSGMVEHFEMDEVFDSQTQDIRINTNDRNLTQKVQIQTNPPLSYQTPHPHSQNALPPAKQRTGKETDYKKTLLIQSGNERTTMQSKMQSKHDSPSPSLSSNQLSVDTAVMPPSSERQKPRPSKDTGNKNPMTKDVKSKLDSTSDTDRSTGSIYRFQRRHSDCDSPTPGDRPQTNDTRVKTPGADSKTEKKPAVVKRRDSNSRTPEERSVQNLNSFMDTPPEGKLEKKQIPVGQPVSSVGVQDLLSEIPGLKVSARETKPFQIQTIAEKDSVNESKTIETSAKKTGQTGIDTRLPGDDSSLRRLTPKPLPRKRTKTPPVRNSDESGNLVRTSVSTTNRPLTPTTESSPSIPVDSHPQGKETISEKDGGRKQTSGISGKVGDKRASGVGESSLRREGGTKKSGKRVSLDPHAVLLHASLDGELDVVKSIIHQVEDPSFPNTEGLTALHHAVCNNHDDIVKFLVEYGCDINAADMQGWTSLHCSAANNCTEICTYLVNRGACVFAVTAIEGKTPSRCCEKDSDNFKECFTYLSNLENNIGIMNDGVVYAVYAYQATRKDELSFGCGERLTVVRRGDVTEKEWWWARDPRGQFGYIPRNLLGLCPRIAPDV